MSWTKKNLCLWYNIRSHTAFVGMCLVIGNTFAAGSVAGLRIWVRECFFKLTGVGSGKEVRAAWLGAHIEAEWSMQSRSRKPASYAGYIYLKSISNVRSNRHSTLVVANWGHMTCNKIYLLKDSQPQNWRLFPRERNEVFLYYHISSCVVRCTKWLVNHWLKPLWQASTASWWLTDRLGQVGFIQPYCPLSFLKQKLYIKMIKVSLCIFRKQNYSLWKQNYFLDPPSKDMKYFFDWIS